MTTTPKPMLTITVAQLREQPWVSSQSQIGSSI